MMKVAISSSKIIGKRKAYDTPDSPEIEERAEMLPENTPTCNKD